MRALVTIFFFLVAFTAGAQQPNPDELRMSIYFGGGSYYISEDQVTKLYHWLDSSNSLAIQIRLAVNNIMSGYRK
jgi:hypothetical protein